jgi:hypothetical protein
MLQKTPRQRRARHPDSRGADWLQKLIDAHQNAASKREQAYWKRPRIHLSALNGRADPEKAKTLGLTDLSAALGSPERLSAFRRLASAYRKDRSLRDYLTLRRQFPEAEIQVARFGGLDPLIALGSKLQELGIDHGLTMSAAGDAFPPDMDELCLQIMERLVSKRDRRKKRGNGHARDLGIPDSLIDYLILLMIEALDWDEGTRGLIPASLIVLLVERLGGSNPEWNKKYIVHHGRWRAACVAAQIWPSGNPPVREFAKRLEVGKSTAARWLADTDVEFRKMLEDARRMFEVARRMSLRKGKGT